MKIFVRLIAAASATVLLSNAVVWALQPMTATVRVSSGSLYDYFIVGEHPQAKDGFDNAHDTISPGNLNATMGLPYISAVILHPDWKVAKEFRGDIRSIAKKHEWQVKITSSLPKGTPLTVALREGEGRLPAGVMVKVKDGGTVTDLAAGTRIIPAPGPEGEFNFFVVVEQPL